MFFFVLDLVSREGEKTVKKIYRVNEENGAKINLSLLVFVMKKQRCKMNMLHVQTHL